MECGQRKHREQRQEGRKLWGVLNTSVGYCALSSRSSPMTVSGGIFPPPPATALPSIRHLSPILTCSVDLSSASHSEILLLGARTRLHSPLYSLTGVVPGTRLVLKDSKEDHERVDLAFSKQL